MKNKELTYKLFFKKKKTYDILGKNFISICTVPSQPVVTKRSIYLAEVIMQSCKI